MLFTDPESRVRDRCSSDAWLNHLFIRGPHIRSSSHLLLMCLQSLIVLHGAFLPNKSSSEVETRLWRQRCTNPWHYYSNTRTLSYCANIIMGVFMDYTIVAQPYFGHLCHFMVQSEYNANGP